MSSETQAIIQLRQSVDALTLTTAERMSSIEQRVQTGVVAGTQSVISDVTAMRDEVNAARDSINTTGKVFTSAEGPAAGIAATTTNQQFSVLSADAYRWTIYRNNAGTALQIGPGSYTSAFVDLIIGIYGIKDTSRSGWVDVLMDADGRRMNGIHVATKTRHENLPFFANSGLTVKGGIVSDSANWGGSRVQYVLGSTRGGWRWSIADADSRIYYGQRKDGTLWAEGKRLLSTDDIVPAPAYQPYQAVDMAGKQQVFCVETATGVIRQISESGSNNTNPVLTADGKYVTYTTDRSTGLLAGLLAAPLAGGAERCFTSRRLKQTIVGDSIQVLVQPGFAAATGRTYNLIAFSGSASQSQAAKLGVIPTAITVSGNVVLGNGAITPVTAISVQPLTQHNGNTDVGALKDFGTRTMNIMVGSSVAILRRRGVSIGSDNYTSAYEIETAPGQPDTAWPAGTIMKPYLPDFSNCLLTIGNGTNNGGETVLETYNNIALMVAWATPLFPQIIVNGLLRNSGLNALLRAGLPKYYAVDAQGRDIYQRFLASGDGSPTDNAAIALGNVPPSLMDSDLIHPNASKGIPLCITFQTEVAVLRGYNL